MTTKGRFIVGLAVAVAVGAATPLVILGLRKSPPSEAGATSVSLPPGGKGSLRMDASVPQHDFALSPALAQKPIPTNTWWISALTGPFPETLFSIPFATNISSSGIGTGIPPVQATAQTVVSPLRPDVQISFPNGAAKSTEVTAYDDDSVTLSQRDSGNTELASIRLVQGLPYEYLTLHAVTHVQLGGDPATVDKLPDGRTRVSFSVAGDIQRYALYVPSSVTLGSDLRSFTLTPGSAGGSLVIAGLPQPSSAKALAEMDRLSLVRPGTIRSSYTASGTTTTTSLDWDTKGQALPFLLLPHQQTADNLKKEQLGQYATLRGTAYLVEGTGLSVQYSDPALLDSLPLPHDDSFFQKSQLDTYLTQAAASLAPTSNGSYSGGKDLWRLANLYQAAQVAGSPTAATFEVALRSELVNWLTYTPGEAGKYFYYDPEVKGLVAASPEFDSQNFNDHHFHYGYFLYAASVLGRSDASFVKDYGQTVNLIAADIANSDRSSSQFPYLRVVDAYEGHSWAAGVARFGDGNNQESVSEAINAWYGMLEWAKVSLNLPMQDLAQALYNQEVATSLTYYFQAGPKTAQFPAGFSHQNITMLWGGKADWSTWFSDQAEAKHGILYLPLSGGSRYLATGSLLKDQSAALTSELSGQAPSNWQDVLGMADALTDPKTAQAAFSPKLTLDSSNSLPYYYLWLGWAGQR